MDDVEYRTASAGDVDAVLALWAIAAENADRPVDSRADVQRLIARDSHALILAVEGGQVIASVIAGFDGWRCHLYRLAVAPHRRRRGVGAALVARAEARFAALGGARADAMVLEDNQGAHRVWRSAGYSAQPRWRRWVKVLGAPGKIRP